MRNKYFSGTKIPKKGTIRTLAGIAYLIALINGSVNLNNQLKPLEDRFNEVINHEVPMEERVWDEEYCGNITKLDYDGKLTEIVKERDEFIKYNGAFNELNWQVKQPFKDSPKHLSKSGYLIKWNPFSKIKSYEEFKSSKNN
jgi:hypothetical protein